MENIDDVQSYRFRCKAWVFAFLMLLCSSSAKCLHAEKSVDSLRIEVHGRTYVMQCDEEIISLVSTNLNGGDRRLHAVKHPESLKSKVIECRISPWRSNTGIAAVIKERVEGKSRFTAIVMPKKKDGASIRAIHFPA